MRRLLRHTLDALTTPASRTRQALRVGLLCLTAPVWLPALPVLLATELGHLPAERRFQARMRRLGRYVGPALPADGGTLICDRTTFSWRVSRLWWTGDDVPALAPVPAPPDGGRDSEPFRWHPFDRWVWDRYLDPEAGAAHLVGVWHAERLLPALVKRYPSCKVVPSFSGGRALEAFDRRLGEAEDRPT